MTTVGYAGRGLHPPTELEEKVEEILRRTTIRKPPPAARRDHARWFRHLPMDLLPKEHRREERERRKRSEFAAQQRAKEGL